VASVLDEPRVWRVTELPGGRPVPFINHLLVVGAGLTATALPVIARILQDKAMIAREAIIEAAAAVRDGVRCQCSSPCPGCTLTCAGYGWSTWVVSRSSWWLCYLGRAVPPR
jgi:hypothetical protein